MKKYLFLFIIPVAIFASEGSKNYDIIPRLFNFVLFFGILFYLLKDFAIKAYNARIKSIADRLDDIQNKLRDSKAKKEQAKKDVELAKVRAKDLLEVAKNEVETTKTKSADSLKQTLLDLEKNYENKKEFESKKATKEVVADVLSQTFNDPSVKLEQSKLIDIINKKVG